MRARFVVHIDLLRIHWNFGSLHDVYDSSNEIGTMWARKTSLDGSLMNVCCGIVWYTCYAISAAMLVCNIIFCISFSSCLRGAVLLVNFATREYENLKLHFTFFCLRFSTQKESSKKFTIYYCKFFLYAFLSGLDVRVKRSKFRFVTLILRTVELSFAVLIMYEVPSTPGLISFRKLLKNCC